MKLATFVVCGRAIGNARKSRVRLGENSPSASGETVQTRAFRGNNQHKLYLLEFDIIYSINRQTGRYGANDLLQETEGKQ